MSHAKTQSKPYPVVLRLGARIELNASQPTPACLRSGSQTFQANREWRARMRLLLVGSAVVDLNWRMERRVLGMLRLIKN